MSRRFPWARTVLATGAILALLPLGLAPGASADTPHPGSPGAGEPGIDGPSIQLDPGFAYYQNRSAQSIADEMVQRGYETVRIFVTNELEVRAEVVAALQDRGIFVWALVLGNGSYSVAGWPDEHDDWLMELISPVDDGYYRFSPFSEGYVDFKKARLVDLVTTVQFDGLEIAESYLPDWDAIDRGYYGDVSEHAQAAFAAAYPQFGEIPNFDDPESPRYYQTDLDRYDAWVEFRVDGVNAYQDEIVNGAGGIRDVRPDIKVATWSLGVMVEPGQDPVAMQREFQGLDGAAMISAVQPDLHVIQTNWPDWIRADLAPDYIEAYQPFIDQIRAEHPDIPLGVQADIGSQVQNQQSQAWLDAFAATSRDLGFATWTAYEYHIGDYIYTDPPRAVSASCIAGTVRVSFDKRVDLASARQPGAFTVTDGTHTQTGTHVSVDGNIAQFRVENRPADGAVVSVAGVTDTPPLRLRNQDATPNAVAPGESVTLVCGSDWDLEPDPGDGDADPGNAALGAPYSVSIPASDSYPDTDGAELTDGIVGTSSFADSAWQGRADVGEYTVTLDLGSPTELARLESVHLRDDGSGIFLPTAATVEGSVDGSTFEPLGDLAIPGGGTAVATAELELSSPVSARYLRFTFDGQGWSFLSEIRAIAQTAASEPQVVRAPSITGAAVPGRVLTTDGGTWDPADVQRSYQWTRDGTDIPGAVAARYRIAAADVGTTLAVRVTATAGAGTGASAASAELFVKHNSTTRVSMDRLLLRSSQSVTGKITVTTSGEQRVEGDTAVVTIAGSRHEISLAGERTEFRLPPVRPGFHLVWVDYRGSDTVRPSQSLSMVLVLP